MAAILAISGASVFTACTSAADNPAIAPDTSAAKDYSERLVPVIDPKGGSHGVVVLRFYNDMPNVAYVGISRFQQMMYPGTTVQVVKTAEHKYQLTSPCGTATVDTFNDVFESDDYEAFTNLMWQVQPGMPNTIYDALPLIRWKSIDIQPQSVHAALDYGKYGIDLRADDTDVYFPFATIADLYIDDYVHIADYNGQEVLICPNGFYDVRNGYPQSFIAPILKDTRPADVADFNYRNLCFTLTNFFGYPGRTLLESKGLKEKGLDRALLDYGEAGQMTRTLLKSQNMYEYIVGTVLLGYLLDDGGHTVAGVTTYSPIDRQSAFWGSVSQLGKEKDAEFRTLCPEYMPIADVFTNRINLIAKLSAQRVEKIGKDVKYYKEGSTAYCWFEYFYTDWLDSFIIALQKAEADPDVKNFVLDISTNGGGSSDIVTFITSVMCRKSDLYYENVLTGQKIKTSYDVDRNLDGKFDVKDDEVNYHLNFALLTSPVSFSCGNLLPALLKDYGIPIIGQKSGGGSCCVVFSSSADGFVYRYSTHRARFVDTKYADIDAGIEPTYTLDTADFFNIPKLTQLIESYYGN